MEQKEAYKFMSNIELLYSFIEDIKKINEPLILKNIFNKLLDNNNNYIKDKDDHKIKGTKNTWIRKISGKKNAFRLFYISKNEKIYLWRIGTKKIEDNIIENYNFENSFPITNSTNVIENKTFNQTNYDYYLGKILYSKNDFSYSREIGSLFLASLNGFFIGPVQSASRVVISKMISKNNQNKAFGLFATSGKLTSFLGPMLVGTITLLSDSQKIGFSSAIFLLLFGLIIILKIRKIQ